MVAEDHLVASPDQALDPKQVATEQVLEVDHENQNVQNRAVRERKKEQIVVCRLLVNAHLMKVGQADPRVGRGLLVSDQLLKVLLGREVDDRKVVASL